MTAHRLIVHLSAQTAFRSLVVLQLALFSFAFAAAQSPRPRITGRIDDAARVVLHGSVRPLARPEFDQGEAPTQTEMTHVRLLFQRTGEQETALDQFLEELQDRHSPHYQDWLTPEEFGKHYGPADADIAAIADWLESEGLTGIAVPKGRTTIEFSGPVGLIEQVFHTSIHSFRNGDEEFLANVTDPSIPAALATVVKGMVHLDTFQPRSYRVPGPQGRYNLATRRIEPVGGKPGGSGARPDYTTTVDSRTILAVVAGDAATMYNTPNKKLNANFSSGTNYDGTGVIIGIGGLSPIQTTPIANYRKLFVGDSKLPTITNVDGATATNSANEAYLDIEVAGALAPGASIHFYTATDLTTAITQMLDDNTVDIFNLSFGECEKSMGSALNQAVLGEWQQAASQGIAVTVASGDSGSATCDSKDSDFAEQGLAVSGYASTPYNVSVGGTDTFDLVSGFSTYVSSTNSAADLYRTLLKPIPESTWNDSQATPGPLKDNVLGPHTINSGGGGVSSCSTETISNTCTSGYAKPTWQTGKGVPADHVRDVPDVSLMAGNAHYNAIWLVCEASAGTTCTTDTSGDIFTSYSGGTSAAAPAFAGILALVEQKTGKRIGSGANSGLYSLFNIPAYATKVFNDITAGNNSVPCISGTLDCDQVSTDNFFLSGYNAGVGYDLATGLGSVNAANLVEYWGATAPLPATVTVKSAAVSVFRGAALVVTITVTGKSGAPTGTVTLTGPGFTSAAKALTNGQVKITIPPSVLSSGTDKLTASYSGDAKFGSAKGVGEVIVTLLPSKVTVTPASSKVSRAKSLLVTVKVSASVGTPTGSVVLSCGTYKSAATSLAGGKATITIPADKLPVGKDTLTATFPRAGNYESSDGEVIITVTK